MLEATEALEKNKESVVKQEAKCEVFKVSIEKESQELQNIESAIEAIPAKIIDIEEVTQQRDTDKSEILRLDGENRSLGKKIKIARGFIEKIEMFLETFDLVECQQFVMHMWLLKE